MSQSKYFEDGGWERVQAPLRAVDPILETFANANGLVVSHNDRGWPSRSIVWYRDDVRCLIQLYLASEEAITFDLWLCASQDRGKDRYWIKETLLKDKPVEAFASQLPFLLESGREKLVEWSMAPEAMEYAVTTN
ncbi:MAG: hypothetical protein H6953_03065 [Chromatiaceae bacterium]|nr:hypothetical protein [Gammaproteobacteria bacterium]MCP5304404.1 hypothetical protein [Chromatiaceae bacterium]MCP5314132.1 hypothetical protein [Chromatiaceae bacterium]